MKETKMKNTDTHKISPVKAGRKSTKTGSAPFQTPPAKAQVEKSQTPSKVAPVEKKSTPAKPAPVKTNAFLVERDAWGGLKSSRMSKINSCVIAAGKKGITTAEIVEQAKETSALVSAQLAWHVAKGNCTRVVEKDAKGKKMSRWIAKVS